MVLLSRNVRGDIDCLHDIPILAYIFLHRDNEEADIMFLSEESVRTRAYFRIKWLFCQ